MGAVMSGLHRPFGRRRCHEREGGRRAGRQLSHARPAIAGLALAAAVAAAGCAGSDPELVAAEITPTPAATPTPVATPTAAPTAPPAPTATPTATPVPALTRGIDETTVRIGVITSRAVFGDPEVGVEARLGRANRDGGVGGRTLELVSVRNDRGDADRSLELAQAMVEEDEVFAVILASVAPGTATTDYLAAQSVPFFGWGFAPGFCEPNVWGFGFNGCLIGRELGVAGASVDPATRGVLTEQIGGEPAVVLVHPSGAAGDTARQLAVETWGDQLVASVVHDPATDQPGVLADTIRESAPDVVLLAAGLDASIDLKQELVGSVGEAIVVDEVAYLPGLLGDFAVADALEGGYSVSQFPPQEEYREATGVVATDLQSAGGDLIYSQAVSLGYWATDLLAAVLDAVGPELDTATFHQVVNVDGVRYEPAFDGSPCPHDTTEIHRQPVGGGALVRVSDGIYRPAVSFSCH